MDYWKYRLLADDSTSEILIAFLSVLPFESFEEHGSGYYAYIPVDAPDQDEALDALMDDWVFIWDKERILYKNWNEEWEKHFQPVQVGAFCGVRAKFHEPFEGVRHELVIQPRMAFGTGHHETTWMCISAMEDLSFEGARVLDYGCGTGILAILAAKLGAHAIEAVDIEEEAYLNTIQNAAENGVSAQITAHQGTLDDVKGAAFDFILANINRNVILASIPGMRALLRPGGAILASGFLEDDELMMREAIDVAGFDWSLRLQKGKWLAGLWRHMPS